MAEVNNLRLKNYTLTDGEQDYHFDVDAPLTEPMADKIIELINAWKNRPGA